MCVCVLCVLSGGGGGGGGFQFYSFEISPVSTGTAPDGTTIQAG